MNNSRRSFLSSLAALPIVGWLFGKAEAKSIDEPWCFPLNPDHPNFAYNAMLKGAIEGAPQHGLYQAIRWIPVTERLPECNGSDSSTHGVYSSILLTWDGTFVCQARLVDFGVNAMWFTAGMPHYAEHERNVTHWAELPAPPEMQS